jgi:hypothetical protein
MLTPGLNPSSLPAAGIERMATELNTLRNQNLQFVWEGGLNGASSTRGPAGLSGPLNTATTINSNNPFNTLDLSTFLAGSAGEGDSENQEGIQGGFSLVA